MFLSLLKAAGQPGSLEFLLVCVAVGLALMYVWPRSRRLGRRWLIAVAAAYLLLSLPWVAHRLAAPLETSAVDPAALGPETIVVALDGDNPVGRIEQAGRVYALASPREMWVLGDAWFLRSIVEAGVPKKRIRHTAMPGTTRDQIAWVKERIGEAPGARLAVIASPIHMRRVSALGAAAGLAFWLVPSPLDAQPATAGLRLFVPAYSALCLSRDALYEHVALAYYRWRGWI